MATYQIEINDEAINEQIQNILNAEINLSLRRLCLMRCSGAGGETSAAVKDLIYSRKDEIIEKVIDRATTEIVKKGLPKLLERMTNNV